MNAVTARESLAKLLDMQLASTMFGSSNIVMGLFTTKTSIDETDALSAFTSNEVAFTGYSRQVVTGWGSATITTDGHARSQADTITFTNSGGSPQTGIKGWFLVDVAATKWVQAGLFDTDKTINAGEDYLTTPFWLRVGEIRDEP